MAESRATFGPRLEHEKSGDELQRDTRTWVARTGAALRGPNTAATLLAAAATTVYFVPATVEIVFPAAAAYGLSVLLGKVRLPLRLPMKSRLRDPNDLDPNTNKPRRAQGSDYLGAELYTKFQAWLGLDDTTDHMAIPGTTGSGKTEALITIAVVNAIAQGSSVLYVEGKGSTKVYAKILNVARLRGREDDVLLLNFKTAGGSDSCTLNAFHDARANMIREILVGQLNEPGSDGNSSMFFGRAVAFLGSIAPILEWLRLQRGIPTTLERVRDLTELANVVRIATKRQVKLTDSTTGHVQTVDLHDMPHEYVQALKDYLGQTGGFDIDVSIKDQKSTSPAEQHSYVTMQLTEVFTQWLVSLGHIFRVESGDIHMEDVVLNRRILVAILPALENSEKTNSSLGKILVANLKAVMSLSLGSKVEGNYADIIENRPSEAIAPFKVVFDELVYYATNGMDLMLAQARELRMQFLLGFQEAAGIQARLGERMWSLLGNTNTQVILKLQDGNVTRSYIEKTVGDTHVTQTSSYKQSDDLTAGHTRADHAEVKQVSRVNWLDVRRLRPGEAIIVRGHERVFVKIPYTLPKMGGVIRRNRPGFLAPPDGSALRAHVAGVSRVREALLKGRASADAEGVDDSPALDAILREFATHLHGGVNPARAAYLAAQGFPVDLTPPDPEEVDPGVEETEEAPAAAPPGGHAFTDMLRIAGAAMPSGAREADAGSLSGPAKDLARDLAVIERFAGNTIAEAQVASLQAIGLRNLCLLSQPPARAPEVEPEKLIELVDSLLALLAPSKPAEGQVETPAPAPQPA